MEKFRLHPMEDGRNRDITIRGNEITVPYQLSFCYGKMYDDHPASECHKCKKRKRCKKLGNERA